MPEYKYKCEDCSACWFTELSISFNPIELLNCPECNGLSRRIIGFRNDSNQIVISRGTTVGKWYKNETGKELMGG